MRVVVKPSVVLETKWYEFAVRFVFGGLVTALAGVIAKKYGPVVGGLFLGFPALFPASATLVEKHERQRKERRGLNGSRRGRLAAGVDAAGAALGSIGLAAFGCTVYWLAPRMTAWATLATATLAWATVSTLAWIIRKKV